MKKRIVIALGGNTLGDNLKEQMEAVQTTAKAIADLAQAGHEIVVVPGNGPQVGRVSPRMAPVHLQGYNSSSLCVLDFAEHHIPPIGGRESTT